MTEARKIPLPDGRRLSDHEALQAARDLHALMQRRRTVRDFDPRPVPREVIEACIAATGVATLTHTPSPVGFLNEILGWPIQSGHSCRWSPAIPQTARGFQPSKRSRLRGYRLESSR